MRYASPESLRLLFLKRLATSRVVDPDAIPAYMDEVDELTKVYFGKTKVANQKDLEHQKRLFQYIHFLEVPAKEEEAIPYNMLANLMRIAKNKDVVKNILERTGHIKDRDSKSLDARLHYVENWIYDTAADEQLSYSFTDQQRSAIKKLAYELESNNWQEDELYARLYAIPKEEELQVGKFFEAAYVLLLNSLRGPRLAQFICAVGEEKIAAMLRSKLSEF
jgi:lysyl-tRNA synthetase class 1